MVDGDAGGDGVVGGFDLFPEVEGTDGFVVFQNTCHLDNVLIGEPHVAKVHRRVGRTHGADVFQIACERSWYAVVVTVTTTRTRR